MLKKIKKETLLLIQTSKNDFVISEWGKNGVNSEIIMKEYPKFIRAVRRLWFYLNLPFKEFWYSPKWKKDMKKYKNFIVHASSITTKVPKYIKKKNPNARVILWYWNPVDKRTHPNKINAKYCEKWTFDINDAKEYSMKYNTQYFFKSIKLNKSKIINDIFFIGAGKGRGPYINKLYEVLKGENMKLDFNLVMQNKKKNKNKYNKEIISDYLPYNIVLQKIAESKSILDIVQNGQSGPTLRTFESLFFRKKLITNNKNLEKFDFYNENNILIIDAEKNSDYINDIKSFLKKPYQEIDENIINKYDFNNWLIRFFKEDR